MLKWLDVDGLVMTGEGNAEAKALEEERQEKVANNRLHAGHTCAKDRPPPALTQVFFYLQLNRTLILPGAAILCRSFRE